MEQVMRKATAICKQWIIKSTLIAFVAVTVLASGADAKSAPDSFADLAQKLLPSVVNISTTQTIEGRSSPEMPQLPPGSPFEDFFKEFFDRNQQNQKKRKATSLGSGFIISKDGYVVTNNHVIKDADEITVILQDDVRLKAELIGTDAKTDLAVLKVKPEQDLPFVNFGKSESTSTGARVGDWVVAIGNPFGLGGTVTAGIISARGRDINAGPYDDFIQTDASINRGNSGGPMFNLDGDVIGINTAIFSPSGGSVGIGFAIPSSTAEPVIKQLIKSGQVKRGWLGVHIQTVTPEIAETLGLDEATGALVASVIKDGPAEKSGIKAGDVILTFNGKKVIEMRRLPRIVADSDVDKKADVEVWRRNKKVTLKVKIGELDDAREVKTSSSNEQGPSKETHLVKELGLTLSVINDEMKTRYNLEDEAKGVVVTEVDGDGSAAEKGVQPGDLIVEINQKEVSNPDQVIKQVKGTLSEGRKSVLLLLQGQGGLRFVAVRVAEKK